jgi:hypothetical protein
MCCQPFSPIVRVSPLQTGRKKSGHPIKDARSGCFDKSLQLTITAIRSVRFNKDLRHGPPIAQSSAERAITGN